MPKANVIDVSHHVWDNGPIDLSRAKAAGVVGVIAKATEGATFQDPTFARWKAMTHAAGLLWGVFHFGTAAPVQDQVDNFLATAAPEADTLVALDFELNEAHPANSMRGTQALEFLDLAKSRLGRPLTLYTGSYMTTAFGAQPVAALSDVRLWWAQFANSPKLHPTWTTYFLWQFTDGAKGPAPHTIDGVGACDCDQFRGTDAELRQSWT